MKQVVVLVVVAIVALAAGAAGGIYMTNAKSKAAIADIQAKMQQSEASSQVRINNYGNIIGRLTGELERAKAEIETLKAPPQAEVPPAAAESQAVITIPTQTQNTPAASARTSAASEGTRLYTIKSGDSFWSIAQKQLGNGSRYEEILKLNPKLSAKSKLVVGTQLKIPAK